MDRSKIISSMFANIADFTKATRMSQTDENVHVSLALDNVIATIGIFGEVTIKRLAKHLTITSGAATQHVISLERFGIVERKPNPQDRRETLVSLTQTGAETHAKILRYQKANMKKVFSKLSDTDLQLFAKLIEKLTATNTEEK